MGTCICACFVGHRSQSLGESRGSKLFARGGRVTPPLACWIATVRINCSLPWKRPPSMPTDTPLTKSPGRKRRLGVLIVVVLALLPALYVLSIGPVARLTIRKRFPLKKYQTIYAPILWACDRSTIIDKTVRRYIELWTDR